MKKLSREERKSLQRLADKLPPIGEQVASYKVVRDDKGYHKEFNKPEVVGVNHFRRMKKLYESHGMAGINQHLDWVKGLQQQRQEYLQKEKERQDKAAAEKQLPQQPVEEPIAAADEV